MPQGSRQPRLEPLNTDLWPEGIGSRIATSNDGNVDRGQAVMFGLLMLIILSTIAFTLLQTQVAPTVQQRTEVDHFRQAQGDLQRIQNSLVVTATQGVPRSVTMRMGSQYPSYLLLVQPPGPSGRLQTAPGTIELRNVKAVDSDVKDAFPVDNTLSLQAQRLAYTPVYRQSPSPTITVSSAGAIIQYPGGNRTVGEQQLVAGRQLGIVNVSGGFVIGGTDPRTLQMSPLSASPETITVTNTGSTPLKLVIETPYTNETLWRNRILRGEFDGDGSCSPDTDARYVCNVTSQSARQQVTLTLETGTRYQLSTALIGLRTVQQPLPTTRPPASYLVHDSPESVSLAWGRRTTLTGQVRDRYHNPEPGWEVHARVKAGTDGTQGTINEGKIEADIVSERQGMVTIRYKAPSDPDPDTQDTGTDFVMVWIGPLPDECELSNPTVSQSCRDQPEVVVFTAHHHE